MAAAAVLLGGGLVGSARAGLVQGGGSKPENDCLVELLVGTTPAQPGPAITCSECDANCDGDAQHDATCSFTVQLCVNQSNVSSCTPTALKKAAAKVKGVQIPAPTDLTGAAACGEVMTVPVKLKGKGTKDGRANVTVKGVSSGRGKDKRVDTDKVVLSCTPSRTACSPATSDVLAVLHDAGVVPDPGPDQDNLSTSSQDQGEVRYIYERHDLSRSFPDVLYLGLNDDIVWPGALIKGVAASSFVYEPILVARAPVTISLNLESASTGGSITRRVADPSLSTLRQGISDLLKEAIVGDTNVPAVANFSKSVVRSDSELNLALGVDVSYGSGDLKSKFNFNSSNKRTKMVGKYTQVYFTVDVDTPQSPADLFDKNIDLGDLAAKAPPGSLPIYVASVKYGMMAIVTVETDFSEEVIGATLDASYHGTFDATVSGSLTAKDVLDQSNVNIVVYGGATLGLQDLETGYQGFKNVIEASKQFNSSSPGIPLLYKFRNVNDNTLALTTLTGEYTTTTPVRLKEHVRVTVENYYCARADDEGVDNTLEMDRLSVTADAYESTGTSIFPGAQVVHAYSSSGDGWRATTDSYFTPPSANTKDITFNNDPLSGYDFSQASLTLHGYARDYDSTSANEEGSNSLTLTGSQLFENGGVHEFDLESSDFTIRVKVTIQRVN